MKKQSATCFHVFNILCMLFGLLMLMAGLMMVFVPTLENIYLDEAESISETQTIILGIALIVIGVTVSLVSIIGFVGVLGEIGILINTYLFIMILLFLGTTTIATIAVVFGHTPLRADMDRQFRPFVEAYNRSQSTKEQGIIETIQLYFKCCGVESPFDYPNKTMEVNLTAPDYLTTEFPETCCDGNTPEIITKCQNSSLPLTERKEYYYKQGCAEKVEAFIHAHTNVLAASCYLVAFFMLLTVVYVYTYKRNYID